MNHRFPVERVRIQNFKAIRDSGDLELGGLTVFIGNNGSGKSSIIEALETAKSIALNGLDQAMRRFHGLHHIRNKFSVESADMEPPSDEEILLHGSSGQEQHKAEPNVKVQWSGFANGEDWSASITFAEREGGNLIAIEHEHLQMGQLQFDRDAQGLVMGSHSLKLGRAQSMMGQFAAKQLDQWQVAALLPDMMGEPRAKQLSADAVTLERNGSNIAEYLDDFRRLDVQGFEDLIESLKFVLPYAVDFQPRSTAEIERSVYLQMIEGAFKIPGWLLSAGTLRIAALMALFRHPSRPKVLFIEELENGLDPRTIGLIVEEIQSAVLSGRQQVVVTTHSPYLLDLFPLDSIVMVEREHGSPTFWRPNDIADISRWKNKYAPGRMYSTGMFSRGSGG